MSQNFSIRNIPADSLPIYEKPTLPEEAELIMLAKTYVEAYGCKLPVGYRLPIGRLTPGGNFQPNVYSLAGNGFSQNIPANKVVPAYVYSTSPNDIRVANANDQTTLAQFLVLSKDDGITGNYFVQGNGIYSFTHGHEYIIGKDYYLGTDGYPTTTRPAQNAQKLFSVLDATTILINIQRLPDLPAPNGKGVCEE